MLDFDTSKPNKPEILSVGALNRSVAQLLERQYPLVWVRGEISNLVQAASGHWYFSLKDAQAQVRAVMFRARAALTEVKPRNGDQVEVRARVTLYEARGDFQLSVESMRAAGKGTLAEQFEQLKAQLLAEGLFDAQRKREIPQLVERIAVITSSKGAALRDVLTTLRRRAPHIEVVLIPSQVQGETAPAQLLAAFAQLAQLNQGSTPAQLVLLVRGGGSIEDLWAFNNEALARAIVACSVPVISGVGHETDFTIADFVADARAATPTAAAQMACSDQSERVRYANSLRLQLHRMALRLQDQARQRIDFAARLLRSPQAQLALSRGAVNEAARALSAAAAVAVQAARQRLVQAARDLTMPSTGPAKQQLVDLARRMTLAQQGAALAQRQQLEQLAQGLRLVNPSAILERGYAIVRTDTGRVLTQARTAQVGQKLNVVLFEGSVDAAVIATRTDNPKANPS
jgi:exodeoxyribonuclease VII large subunit